MSLAFASLFPAISLTTIYAANDNRSLNLYFVQTNERQEITFMRNGRYVQEGINELNKFLRDWRRNELANMDPAIFDLIWKVYQEVGATEPITVVSAYRSRQTNEMLRARSRGAAKNSQHTIGSAIDFYIKGVPLAKLRETAMRMQVGGVGYYPNSGSPFIHLDTGGVRAWPRMTRAQLQRLFPDGRTLHIPTNGIPISAEGRRYAEAQWSQCKSVPCAGSGSTPITAPTGSPNTGSGRTLLDLFFGNQQEQQSAPVVVASNSQNSGNTQTANNAPAQRRVAAIAVSPQSPATAQIPAPASRALFLDYRNPQTAPNPAIMPRQLLIATSRIPQIDNIQTGAIAVAAISPDTPAPAPANEVLALSPLIPASPVSANVLTAYAPTAEPEPDAQRALQMLIERRSNNLALNNPAPILRGSIASSPLSSTPVSASLGSGQQSSPTNNLSDYNSFFNNTFNAVANARPAASQQNNIALSIINTKTMAAPLYDNSIPMRSIEFYAPDLEHVGDNMVMQTQIAEADFAIMFEPDEADFNPATELGPQTIQINFSLSENPALLSNSFSPVAPVIISSI